MISIYQIFLIYNIIWVPLIQQLRHKSRNSYSHIKPILNTHTLIEDTQPLPSPNPPSRLPTNPHPNNPLHNPVLWHPTPTTHGPPRKLNHPMALACHREPLQVTCPGVQEEIARRGGEEGDG